MAENISNAAILLGLGLITALGGCTRLGLGGGGLPAPAPQAAPITAAPTSPVRSSKLSSTKPTPPSPSNSRPVVEATPQPSVEKPVEVAKVAPTSGKPVTRQAMVGAWTVSTGGSNCQIFLALTKWSGGYRAASRGCSAAAISDVQAWDVKGKQVVLVTSSGGNAATLYRSAEERYDGSTSGGGAISFSR